MRTCHHCGKEITLEGDIGRREACPSCGADLHSCLNCRFHDPAAYNQCRETQAERVLDKERSNFCDFFVFQDGSLARRSSGGPKDSRRQLDDLFGSK